MQSWIIVTLKWFAILVVILMTLAWLILAAPFFSGFRKTFIENILSEQIGQAFVVDGDVRIVLGGTTRVHVSGAKIPSTTMKGTNLAELNLLEWELNLPALLDGRVDLDNLVVDGLQANVITTKDGTTSWTKLDVKPKVSDKTADGAEKQRVADEIPPESASIFNFLKDKTVTFTNIGLVVVDETSGFEFVFDLQSILLEQLEGGKLVSVTGEGTVNGEAFNLDGKYPVDQPFTNVLSIGDISVSYNGSAISREQGGGYAARLVLETGEIGDIFDVLGLTRSFEGHGALSADITSQSALLAIQNLKSSFNLSKGQEITITGDVKNIIEREGFDVKIEARLHPINQPPKKAASLKELKLTDIVAQIVSTDQKLEFKKIDIGTNAFDQGLEKVGPISIGRIYRTPNQTLGLKDVQLQAGPEEAPYIVANGDVGDVFKFKGVDLKGTLTGPSSLLLKSLSKNDVAKFGRVTADFEVSDKSGDLSLTKLTAQTEDTDLWSLGANLSVKDVTSLEGIYADLKLRVEKSAEFLGALGVEPIDVGALEFGVTLEGQATAADLGVLFKAGGSDLQTNLSVDLSKEINVIRGQILSERLQLADLRDGAKAIVQIGNAGRTAADQDEDIPLEDSKPPIQPLVLENKREIFDLERILTETDLEIALVLKEFVGDAGTSSMNSQFSAKEGQIEAGPIELFYGPGFFKVTAKMDAIETPELLRVNGSTNGWDFGKILDAVGVGIEAHGTLDAAFDVAGNVSSGKAFVNSLTGSASLNMGNGSVATSLLELAGLGIFPWLFSKELAEGETEIVCVKAPVRINTGRVSFDSIVVETRSVQLVVQGEVDWIRDTIGVRAEPRRVGDPLARSAWPFEVNGKLSEPKFKLKVGGSRSKRTDGAAEMPADRVPCQPDIMQLE
jgi:uncharacterized protein involved in outer membrane biogenesis